MAVSLRPLRGRDLAELPSALAGACHWIEIETILTEKLGPGPSGHAPSVWIASDSGGPAIGVAVQSGDRLRLLIVANEWRQRGVGTMLLNAAEASASTAGERLRTGDEAGNYVAPGIDTRDQLTLAWFQRRGYREVAENQSLLIELTHNPKVTDVARDRAIDQCRQRGYDIERLAPERVGELARAIDRDFGRAWAFEVERAASEPSGAFVARRGGELAAFAAHDGNNRGLGHFGPAATWPAHQGAGLGAALLLCCLRDVAAAGRAHCTISWIGPRGFYDRVASIEATRSFSVMEKSLTQGDAQ